MQIRLVIRSVAAQILVLIDGDEALQLGLETIACIAGVDMLICYRPKLWWSECDIDVHHL